MGVGDPEIFSDRMDRLCRNMSYQFLKTYYQNREPLAEDGIEYAWQPGQEVFSFLYATISDLVKPVHAGESIDYLLRRGKIEKKRRDDGVPLYRYLPSQDTGSDLETESESEPESDNESSSGSESNSQKSVAEPEQPQPGQAE